MVWELIPHLISLEFSSLRNFIFLKSFSGFYIVLCLPSSPCLSIVSLLFLAFSPLPNAFSMSWFQLQNFPFFCIKILGRIHFFHWLQELHRKHPHTLPVWSHALPFAYLRCYSKQRSSVWNVWEVLATYWMWLQIAENIFSVSLPPSAIVKVLVLVEWFLLF